MLLLNIYRSKIAAQFSRVLRIPNNEYLTTGNYLVDYQDSLRRFGAMLHGIIIANPSTNIPEVVYVTLNNYASGMHVNHVSVSCIFSKVRIFALLLNVDPFFFVFFFVRH